MDDFDMALPGSDTGTLEFRYRARTKCWTRDRQLQCTLLARHAAGYRDPWLIVTDLAPEVADVAWYGLRAWIECGFKDSKRRGWHWEQTKMLDPARAEWLWLAIAVATLWTVQPRSYRHDRHNLTEMRAELQQMIAHKARPLRVAGVLFGMASLLLVVLIASVIVGA